MMDPVYWSRAIRSEREREAAKWQFVARVRTVLRRPPAPLRRDAVRTLLADEGRRSRPTAACCIFGAGA
jgi:hypothetical protein